MLMNDTLPIYKSLKKIVTNSAVQCVRLSLLCLKVVEVERWRLNSRTLEETV